MIRSISTPSVTIPARAGAPEFDLSMPLRGPAGSDGASGSEFTYASRVAAAAATIDLAASYLRTAGYYESGDRGHALYDKVSADPGPGGFASNGGTVWWQLAAERVNVRQYGALGDATEVVGATSISSGAASLTVAGAAFTAADIGKRIRIPGAGPAGVPLSSQITGVGGATAVTLQHNASTTLSAVTKTIIYGTDNTDAFQEAFDAAQGKCLWVPAGKYFFSALSTSIDPGLGSVVVCGEGRSLSILVNDQGTAANSHHLIKNEDDDASKGDMIFMDITFKGSFTEYGGPRVGNPVWLFYYNNVAFIRTGHERQSSQGMLIRYCRESFVAVDGFYKDCVADFIQVTNTANVWIERNRMYRNGDDAIAVHTDTTLLAAGAGVLCDNVHVRDNILINCGIISVTGGRNLDVTDNTLLFCNGGINVLVLGTPYFLAYIAFFNLRVSRNKVINSRFVTVGTHSPGSIFGINIEAPDQSDGSGDFIPGEYSAGSGIVEPIYHYQDLDLLDAANPAAPLEGVEVSNNFVGVSNLPNVAAFSDYGYGTILFQSAEYDPATASAEDFRLAGGIRLDNNLKDAIIFGNRVRHMGYGIVFSAPTTNRSYQSVVVAYNDCYDCINRALYVGSGAFNADIRFEFNSIDGDPLRLNSNSNNNGSYDANTLPSGIEYGACIGLSIIGNHIRNVCQPIAGTGQALTRDNVLHLGAPAAIGFSTSNKGIGDVPRAGAKFIHHIIDADRTSATYGANVTMPSLEATAMPSTGTYVVGQLVKNTTPTIDGSNMMVMGWMRLTTGTGHVAGTDWAVVRTSHVTPAT